VQALLAWCGQHPGQPVLVLSYSFMHALVRVVTEQGVVCDVPYPHHS
jgi:hypothetical protein